MFIANPQQPLHPHQPTFLRRVNPSRSIADGRRAQIKSLRRPSQSHCPSPRGGFLHRPARRSGRDCTLLRWTSASRPDTCGGAATWERKRGGNKSTRHRGLYSSEKKVSKQFGTNTLFKGEDEAQIIKDLKDDGMSWCFLATIICYETHLALQHLRILFMSHTFMRKVL